MDFCFQSTKVCVTYGSIISFMNDVVGNNETPTITYDPTDPLQDFNGKKEEDYVDFLKSRNILYSNGAFNEFCYLYSFKDKKDIQNNYFNTLFLVLPPCEYDAMLKFKNLIKNLKNEILMDDNIRINNQQIIDSYIKFKQELKSNHEQSVKFMRNDNNKVNFNDSVQFLHIKSGKFLSFKTHDEYLKTYIELSEKMSKNTIFRFISAFKYQEDNSTNVFFNMTIKISCGEKNTRNEKYISNITNNFQNKKDKTFSFGKKLLNREVKRYKRSVTVNERAKSIRISLNNIFPDKKSRNRMKENFFSYSTQSNLAYKNFGKKLLPEDNYIGIEKHKKDYWRLINFSQNYIKDYKYINLLDYFCIQNIEKNLFIQATDMGEPEGEDNFDKFKKMKEEMGSQKFEVQNNQQISEKLVDEKEKIPYMDINDEENKNDTNLKDNKEQNNNMELNYIFDENFYSNMKYELNINSYNDRDFIEPYGLFKFEIISPDKEINSDLKTNIKLLSEECYVRIINVFTNKVISVNISQNDKGNKVFLTLVDNIDITNIEEYEKTLFKIEKSNETETQYFNKLNFGIKEDDNEENENDKDSKDQENKIEENNTEERDTKLLLKNDYIKIKTKKGLQYIGIRLNNNDINNRELILTKSLSDLTRFKLNFLDEEDKYELHFFEQLLWNLKNILRYFKKEVEANVDEHNYEHIQHVLITLEDKIKIFKDNRNVKIVQENKFDFLKIIEKFNIVSKLIDLFIANWFHDYVRLDYNKFESKLSKYFSDQKNEIKCKQIISKKILKILTLIYDLEKSYLDQIAEKLLYFFMFVGRDDKCTKFLVHILKNNRKLLISLCPTNLDPKINMSQSESQSESQSQSQSSESQNSEKDDTYKDSEINSFVSEKIYENLKKCLLRIINDYNHLSIDKLMMDFSSVFLFFKLMNCLLIYNNQPFMQFYDYYFEELNLFTKEGENYYKPNFDKNPILIDFFVKDDTIYAKKAKFFNSSGMISEENYSENDDDESDTNKISSTNKVQSGSSHNYITNNKEYIEFKLSDLIGINNSTNIDKYYKLILFTKLVSLNIFFYSNISLCNEKLKAYLRNIFNINDIIKNYLYLNKNSELSLRKKQNNLNNDLKCSLIQLLNYLYFRVPFPFWEKIYLFKTLENINPELKQLDMANLNNNEKNIIEEQSLDNIIIYVGQIISNSININVKRNDPFLLLQIFECTKYILRYLYSFKNKQERIDSVFDLMSKILQLLDKYIGMSANEDINGRLTQSLNSILNDQLDLKDPLFLVTDNFQFLFQKFRKKLETTIKTHEVKNLKKEFKDLFGTAVAKEDKSYISNTINRNLKRKSVIKLKNYDLSHIILEFSINSNKEQKTIINEIMIMMTEIFLEFLQYIESLCIDEAGMNLLGLKQAYDGDQQEFERLVIEQVIKKNNTDVSKEHPKMFKNRYYDYKELENKYLEKFKEHWKLGDNISCFFFKFLRVSENVEINNLTMQIIYRLNNQQKIYYDNISNYVIFYYESDYIKFLKIKNLFIKISLKIKSINFVKRLDKSTLRLYNELDELFEELIKNLYNEKKWKHDNNILNNYEIIRMDNQCEESESSSKEDKESSKIKDKEEIKTSSINKENSKENEELIKNQNDNVDEYYLNENNKENSNINLLIVQQTLYNLGFINLINDFFKYIEWLVKRKEEDMKDEYISSIERILISIYKLLVLFIYNNNKHQTIIKEILYLYINPLRIKNKGQFMLFYYLGYFLLNLVYNFKDKKDLNEIKNLDKIINTLKLLHELEWNNCKEIIPFYVESLKIIIEFAPVNYFPILFQILKDITNVIINAINNKSETKNDIISFKRILELIIVEQNKKSIEENRNTAILSLDTIIATYLSMIKLLILDGEIDLKYLKLCKIFNLVTNIIYNNFYLYKGNFDDKIIYNRKLKKTLYFFCKKVKITNSLIYTKKNQQNIDLKEFNEFLGLTIPKLYIILQLTDDKNNIDNENDTEFIISVSNKFYKKIYETISKSKSILTENTKIFLSDEDEDDIIDILNNVHNDSLKYLELVYDLIKPNLKYPLINEKSIKQENDDFEENYHPPKLKFNEIWNKIQLEINYRQGLNRFQEIVKSEINKDRTNFVKHLFKYFKEIQGNNTNNIKNIKEPDKNLRPDISFFDIFFNCFKEFYSKDLINFKSELFFFYWSNIYIMEYNEKEKNFNSNKTKYNKEYFNKSNIIEFTINQFKNINVFSNSYENLLFIKFFNSYLSELDDENRAEILNQFIDKPEAKNIFALLKHILSELQKKIDQDKIDANNQLTEKDELDQVASNYLYHQEKEKDKYNYSPHLFENDLDEYELALEFISNLSENNEVIKGKMKDYLRIQYNNAKYHNFIIILAGIIEDFISDENDNGIKLIEKYFSIIIKIIECITKCCNGDSKENQDCVVKETKILQFSKFILEKITYRQKLYFDDEINVSSNDVCGIRERETLFNSVTCKSSLNNERIKKYHYECQEIGLDRKRLAYLKFKLLLFLTVITVGRQKDDKIYELVHQVIDFNTLSIILVETYKEILIEKNCTKNPELLSFDENMLSRMDNPDYKKLTNWIDTINDDSFIIFENGTYTFILINIYFKNLSKPIDIDNYNQIEKIKNILKKVKCKENKKSIFSNFFNFAKCLGRCFRAIWDFKKKIKIDEDFKMNNAFARSYRFFFQYTQNVEINFNDKVIPYYVKLSPICKCLTNEIKEEFYSRLDRSSTKSKIECLFENIEFFQYQLTRTKKRIDIFNKYPILDLLFNQYNFYREVFLIIGAFLNLLIFASYYRTNDEHEEVIEYSEDFEFRYGFLYKSKNIKITENILLYCTLVEMIFGFLILVNYIIIHIPKLTYYNQKVITNVDNEDNNDNDESKNNDNTNDNSSNYKKITSIILNVCLDTKLIFHLILFIICIVSFIKRNYTILIILLIDVIERSKILMCIVKSIWLPKKQILVTLFLFYLIAYYFSILTYLFIPSQVPSNNCITFRNCFFTLCDQTIKNSNGIINYLKEEGLYFYKNLWANPRFYIDNWFAIIDTMLILQILAGIIIDNFISQREENDKKEKDRTNKCFICGLKKTELSKYYNQLGFNEHIKLDHYLWNYVFVIFNIMKKNPRTLIPIDLIIYESYNKKIYSTWIPYKKCILKIEEDLKEEKNKDESEEDEEED